MKNLIQVVFLVCFATFYVQAQKYNGVSIEYINDTISPCSNFYEYCSGNWIENNDLPDGYSRYGFFDEKDLKIRMDIINMLDTIQSKNKNSKSQLESEIAKYYLSALSINLIWDETLIDSQLNMIRDIKTMNDLSFLLGYFQLIGFSPFFDIYPPKSWELRGVYYLGLRKSNIINEEINPNFHNKRICDIENSLKQIHEKDKSRNKSNSRKLVKASFLRKLIAINWSAFFVGLEKKSDKILISNEALLEDIGELIEILTIDEVKQYLEWKFIAESKALLQSIALNVSVNNGSIKNTKKYKASRIIQRSMPNILAVQYMNQYFHQEIKSEVEQMITQIKSSFIQRMKNNHWLSEEAKSFAVKKIENMKFALGGPEIVFDPDSLEFSEANFLQNVYSARTLETKMYLQKVGLTIDREHWNINAFNTNAWYSPSKNKITLPASAINQLFDLSAPIAINYGLLGTTISHEMAHAFDPQSVNHDHLGIRKKTLTLADTKQYKLLQDSLSRIYNKLLIKENHYTNGQKVLIETISDHLGLAVAFNAFKLAQTNIAETEIDGYSGFEMFFISYAQKYREHLSEECIQRYILDYYHPLPRYRVNIPVYSIPEFFEIFCLDQSQKKEAYFSVW